MNKEFETSLQQKIATAIEPIIAKFIKVLLLGAMKVTFKWSLIMLAPFSILHILNNNFGYWSILHLLTTIALIF